MKFPVLLLLWLAGSAFASAAGALPLQPGERLVYRVSWAILPGAGEIRVGSDLDPVVPGRVVVTTTTSTRGLTRMVFPFEARSESAYNVDTGLLASIHESSKEKEREREYSVSFDHEGRRASYVNRNSREPLLLEMPQADPVDLIIALVRTRGWDLKPGESRDSFVVWQGNDFYEVTIHAIGYEEVTTPLGTFKTLVLEPRMDRNPKGMFRRGNKPKVWIAQDERRLPVRFAVEFKVGTGTANLVAYTPPSVRAPAPPPANAKNPRP
jgi:hypothetical protein